MNTKWLLSILGVSLFLLCTLKAHQLRSLNLFFKGERVIKLQSFAQAQKKVAKEDLEILKLWESMLTGRAAPLSKLIKQTYQSLGLNHLFTPSGFHLSAAVFPFLKLLNKKYHLFALIIVGSCFFFLPGMSALKRMIVIKVHQQVLGLHLGFILALIIDMFFGTFQSGALSFTYSFLFLGIIYSGLKGLGLIIWFFIAQILLAYFQNSDISPLLLIFSPVLNLGFGILMPVLFALSFPLWDWQLHTGIFLLKHLQKLVDLFSEYMFYTPLIEIHIGILLIVGLLLFRRVKPALVIIVFLSSSLNLDRQKNPGPSTNEFVPQKALIETKIKDDFLLVSYGDGKCKMKLVRGYWYENCSPKRGSSRQKFKKLSYPS